MKKTLLTVMVAAAMTTTLAQAVTINQGTLQITGSITEPAAQTCTLTVNGASAGTDIDLTPVALDAFSAVGAVTAPQAFTLQFASCPAMTTAQLQLDGTADTVNANAFSNTGTATGVAVQIQETTDTASNMVPGQLNSQAYAVSSDSFNIPLSASIVRTSVDGTPVTAGTVVTTATMQITYN